MKRQFPSELLEQQFFTLATRRAPLSESIQLGAQLMRRKAVELEVTEFLERGHYQRHADSLLRGYCNGYEDKGVQTAEGPLHLKRPQVRNTIDAFESVWLRALLRRSDKLAALIERDSRLLPELARDTGKDSRSHPADPHDGFNFRMAGFFRESTFWCARLRFFRERPHAHSRSSAAGRSPSRGGIAAPRLQRSAQAGRAQNGAGSAGPDAPSHGACARGLAATG